MSTRININWALCKTKPFDHQKEGVRKLVTRPAFALFDEMGAGKTKQVIDAAGFLFLNNLLSHVVIVAPAAVRTGWADPELGQIREHSFVANYVEEFHTRGFRLRWHDPLDDGALRWTVTNYEFIRDEAHRKELIRALKETRARGGRILLGLDESWAIKNHRSQQTKAVEKIREYCDRVVILNGTPIASNPLDLYAQMHVLDPAIIGSENFFAFRGRYAQMGGFKNKVVVGWNHLEELQAKIKPHQLRRMKEDCLDLPPKLPPQTLEVKLDAETWRHYVALRDELATWFDTQEFVSCQVAATKLLRLAQLTAGFVGGVERFDEQGDLLDFDALEARAQGVVAAPTSSIKVVGDEKLRFLLGWLEQRLAEDPAFKLIVWCRFRPELERVTERVATLLRGLRGEVHQIYGGQTRKVRDEALRSLDPRFTPQDRPVVLLGNRQAGGIGLNLVAAHHMLDMTHDFNLKERDQSRDRIHRPGQTKPCNYWDLVATGPKGQRTFDHYALAKLRAKRDVADFTMSDWRSFLVKEE